MSFIRWGVVVGLAVAMAMPALGAPRRKGGRVGIQTDVGLPDGATLGVAVRPIRPVRIGLAATTNGVGPGMRGGVTLKIPIGVAPSVTGEVGWFPSTDGQWVAHKIDSDAPESIGVLERVGYRYWAVRGGLEFGNEHVSLVVQAGMSELYSTLYRVEELLGEESASVELEPLKLRVLAPSARVGLVFWFPGKKPSSDASAAAKRRR